MSLSMRFQGTLEKPLPREDFEDDGEEQWEQVCTLRFSLAASEGSDTTSDDQIDYVQKFDVRTRYRADIQAGMRINMIDRKLNIASLPVDKDQRKRWMEFVCEELV